MDKFCKHPKDFKKIASFLDNKTVSAIGLLRFRGTALAWPALCRTAGDGRYNGRP